MGKIQMVDLQKQYSNIKEEVNQEIQKVLDKCDFINGSKVAEFGENLGEYIGVEYVVPCANGTDALQIALMALDLKPGDEVIVPAFTYVATAEVIGLLGLTPVMTDVDYNSFNITVENIERAITHKSKAIVPVHLFGQSCDMESILNLAKKHGLAVVEDNAQALGAQYTFSDGTVKGTGAMGDIGCTSFFPSKNLGCYGDGGAIFTNDKELVKKIKMIANHGQIKRYYHEVLGCNSRLDTIQAAILDVKLKHLPEYEKSRYEAASYYSQAFADLNEHIKTPEEMPYSTHVYHQYTLKVLNGERDALKEYLEKNGIPANVYYPLSLDEQNAFKGITKKREELINSKNLTKSVLSLPIHTELSKEVQDYIIEHVRKFFKG